MSSSLMIGPLLGVESDIDYTVCFLTDKTVSSATVILDGVSVQATQIQTTPKGYFWQFR
jgi:hypothetical protein